MPNLRTRERVFSILAIICSLIGGFGLLLLSILDAKHFPNIHNNLLLVFIVCVGLSAIFSVIEVYISCRSVNKRVLFWI